MLYMKKQYTFRRNGRRCLSTAHSSLQLASAAAAEFRSGRVFCSAILALVLDGRTHGRSTVIAKAYSLRVFFTTHGTNCQCQRCAAVAAELTRSGRLSAGGADHRLAFQLPFPDGSGFGYLVDIAAHGLCPRFRHRHLLPGRAVGAERFIFVVAGITHPLMTAVAAVKMPLYFILGSFKSLLMLLLPFGAHTVKSLGKDISAAFQ